VLGISSIVAMTGKFGRNIELDNTTLGELHNSTLDSLNQPEVNCWISTGNSLLPPFPFLLDLLGEASVRHNKQSNINYGVSVEHNITIS